MPEVWIKVDVDLPETSAAEVALIACRYVIEGATRDLERELVTTHPTSRIAAERAVQEAWSTAWLRAWDNETLRSGEAGGPRPEDCINVFDSRPGQVARHYYLEEVHEWEP